MMAASFTRQEWSFVSDELCFLILLQAPLLLPFFALIPNPVFMLLTSALYIVLDLVCANSLVQVAESDESRRTWLFQSPRGYLRWDGVTVAAT